MRASVTSATALLATMVSAHGNIVSPPARAAGAAMAAACGEANVQAVTTDPTIPLEDLTNPPATCQVDLCRGAKFEDNAANVQTFKPGEVVQMKAAIPIPHEGPMNVSVVDTATNKVIGEPLIVFDTYADEKLPQLPANNTDFSVTMPNLPAGTCAQGGQCVLQWFWVGTSAKQTYESCVDFVMG
ncbi:Chitin binding protein [Colletotrichum higginsianum IMI 349063]|uniref:Chitin binding protein n=2 Tax=Colletotrichum higginsianum TaxID=80884 RepID=A0A1B7YTC3_COLHI|nr:Chitin binding protein [Colletotrichum higginsianum IMI 349063]OBR15204.1 Chitin binding protein [Colletotrichum higginsianum IMI 349063]TID04804.1 hypothetical protein CH35J_002975 [Colletotrichum higginsianum]GJC92528.1 chitin binding protein [Colletotrichum higginsianum]